MANAAHDLAVRLERVVRDLSGPQMQKVLTDVGVRSKPAFADAVSRDLGGTGYSRWKAQMGVRFDPPRNNTVTIVPVPRARGPWRVAEDGRRAGASKGRKRKGRVGATRGRGTWSDAARTVESEAPQRALDAVHGIVLKGL